jgi:hypothetical protein
MIIHGTPARGYVPSPFLTAGELASLRAAFAATLPDVCTIEYPTEASDGMGGGSVSWLSRGANIPCRLSADAISAFGRKAGITAEQMREGLVWTLSVAYDQTLEVKDRVTVGGKVFQVLQVSTGDSEMALKRAQVVRWE